MRSFKTSSVNSLKTCCVIILERLNFCLAMVLRHIADKSYDSICESRPRFARPHCWRPVLWPMTFGADERSHHYDVSVPFGFQVRSSQRRDRQTDGRVRPAMHLLYTSLFAMKGSSWKYKTEKSLTNYSLCTVRQFIFFSHKTILTVIRIDNNSLWQSTFQ